MDDIIKALSELMSQSPKPRGGIADSMKGADFIGRRLTKSEVGDNAIIGSKLTDASRFNPFSVRNIGVNNRYIMMREYADDLAKRFEQTIQFIKNNPDVRLTQAQKDNILYNVGVYRRVSKEKNKIEKGLTEQGKNVDEIFNNRTQSLPNEMLTLEDQLEKFFRNIQELQKKIKETEDVFEPEKVSPERKQRIKNLYYGKGYTNDNSSLYRGLGSNFLPKLHEAGIIKLDDTIYNNLKEGKHHYGGAMTFAPDPVRIWRYHFGDDVFDKMDNWNYNDGETVFEWLKRNNIEPIVKSGPSSATDYMHPVEIMERLKDENRLFNVYKNPKAESSQGYINIDDPKQQLDRIGFHGENIRFLEDSLQKSSPDDFRDYMKAKPKPETTSEVSEIKEGIMQVTDEPAKAGKGRFTKAQVLEQVIKNTIRDLGDDPEVGEYIKEVYPRFLKEIQNDPSKANNENFFRNLTSQFDNNPEQRLVVYDDDTVDFYTKGTKYREAGEQSPIDKSQALADELGISFEEAVKIGQMEPDDQVLEIERLRTLLNRDKPKNAEGGLIGLHI